MKKAKPLPITVYGLERKGKPTYLWMIQTAWLDGSCFQVFSSIAKAKQSARRWCERYGVEPDFYIDDEIYLEL